MSNSTELTRGQKAARTRAQRREAERREYVANRFWMYPDEDSYLISSGDSDAVVAHVQDLYRDASDPDFGPLTGDQSLFWGRKLVAVFLDEGDGRVKVTRFD
jgi:hypothetical protein